VKDGFMAMLILCAVAALAIFAIYLALSDVPPDTGLLDWWRQ
jgi:hypothetical protein